MENKYIYRKHLREPAKFFLTLELMFIIIYTVASVIMMSAFNDTSTTSISLIIFIGVGVGLVVFTSLELLFIYFALYRRFKKINVTLTEEGIIYNNAKCELKIPYEHIIDLKFPSLKYIGGWINIKHTTGNIRLTVVLENIGDMLKNLKNKLDERNISYTYKEKGMYNFFKTATYSDQSWERVYENIKFFLLIIAINLGVGAVFACIITDVSVKIFVLTCSIIGPNIPFIIAEIILARKLAKGASKKEFSVPERDKPLENKIYKWLFGIYTIIYLIVLIIISFK
jgi:hypothetical protein